MDSMTSSSSTLTYVDPHTTQRDRTLIFLIIHSSSESHILALHPEGTLKVLDLSHASTISQNKKNTFHLYPHLV